MCSNLREGLLLGRLDRRRPRLVKVARDDLVGDEVDLLVGGHHLRQC